MRARTWAITLIATAGTVGLTMAVAPAEAQDMVNGMSAVQQCVCAERELSIRGEQMSRARGDWERARSEADGLTREVEVERPRVNVDSRRDIEAFSALLARRDAAARSYREVNQQYAAAVARYNYAVNQNNASCAGRLFDPAEVAAARANPACPRY